MKKPIFNFLLIFLTAFYLQCSQAQDNNNDIQEKLIQSDYFHNLEIEKFFIHTNKNTYFSGEKIWFKSYIVYDNTNKPSINTNNVYLSLFSKNGALISSKLFLAENGYTYGEFELNKELNSGTYYFQVGTNYNLNFNRATSNKITIINLKNKSNTENSSAKLNTSKTVVKEDLKLDFYPEANSLVYGIANKIIYQFNTNKSIEGQVIDAKTNKIVSKFKSDSNGLGSIFLLYNSNYKAIVSYKNKDYSFTLPNSKSKGFNILKTREAKTGKTKNFIIKTNNETITDYSTKTIFAVLHRNGALKSIAPIKVKKGQLDYILKFNNSELFQGLNTITLFNENNKPLVERHFYNTLDNHNFNIIKNELVKDSLTLSLIPSKKFNNANISVSVHSTDFLAYNSKSSITSQFGITNYLPKNHFNFNDTLIKDNSWTIDNYLQILSKDYSAFPYKGFKEKELIFNNEIGITVSGKLNTKIDTNNTYTVLLTSKSNSLFLITELQKDKSFKFENIYLEHPSDYQLALMNKKGKMVKSNFVLYKNYTTFNPLLSNNSIEQSNVEINSGENILNQLEYLDFINFDNVTQLDEVTIENDETDNELEKDRRLKKTGIIGETYSRSYKIDDSPYADLTIEQFVQTLGGVTLKYNDDGSLSLINERFTRNFRSEGLPLFTISVDGIPQGTDFSIMSFRRVREFEYVIVNRRGIGFGSSFAKGIITFVSKKGEEGKNKYVNTKVKYFESEIGFTPAALKFENAFISYGTQSNKHKLSSLDWYPNVQFEENKIKYLKINTLGTKDIMLIINGFNPDGKLIHQVINF